jgi:hypothetical protein
VLVLVLLGVVGLDHVPGMRINMVRWQILESLSDPGLGVQAPPGSQMEWNG